MSIWIIVEVTDCLLQVRDTPMIPELYSFISKYSFWIFIPPSLFGIALFW